MIKQPVLFVHGLIATGKYYRDYTCIEEYAKSLGINLIVYDRQKGLTLNKRVDSLKSSLLNHYHIIGHSAGGLDAAFACEQDCKPLTVTLMGSPVLGSPIADLIFERDTFELLVLHKIISALDVEQMIKEMTTIERQTNIPELNNSTAYYSLPFTANYKKLDQLSKSNFTKLCQMGHWNNDGTVPTDYQILPGSHVLRPDSNSFYDCEHKAQTAPFRYGYFPWSKKWKQCLDVAFKNIAYWEKLRGV